MTLFEAVQLFAKEVPEGYEASIRLEFGDVEISYPNGDTFTIVGEDLTDMVLIALDMAKRHAGVVEEATDPV